jgi:hypothetical protein
MSTELVFLVVVLILLFGGGGFYWSRRGEEVVPAMDQKVILEGPRGDRLYEQSMCAIPSGVILCIRLERYKPLKTKLSHPAEVVRQARREAP